MPDGARDTEVVAGLIFREGHLLVCQRREDGMFPLQWEFPGGKVERGETHEDALRRELREELEIEINRISEVFRHRHEYAEDLTVDLSFYKVHEYQGEIKNMTFRQIRWAAIDDLRDFDFLSGDMPLVERLVSSGAGILPS